ncbi:MAG: universal stress protein [Myxococcota bacterium]
MNIPQHLLVGTDFSDESHDAIFAARLLARTFGARVTLASAFDPTPFALPLSVPTVSEMIASAVAEIEASIENKLGELRDAHLANLPVETRVLRHPSASVALVELATELSVDLIVVGSHGRSGWRRALIGSVAERVVRLAPCGVHVARR